MRSDPRNPLVASQSHHLHRQGTDIHPHASQRVFFWQRLLPTGGGFVFDSAAYASKASWSKIVLWMLVKQGDTILAGAARGVHAAST
jgi:hypothetical protein